MTEKEFDVLYAAHKGRDLQGGDSETLFMCQKNGWLSDGSVTEEGYEALAPYKVDNAIIMAAGRSRRCMPLSNYLPKGLFEIKGDTMVERQIKQLRDAGVSQIVLVVGYLKEKYYEMAKKHPDVIVVENTEWEEKNNISSLYAAKEWLGNSYICCSDNWFAHNVYRDYVFDSYYACKYTDEFLDEYCVKATDKDGYMASVKKGGERCWYTIGEAFFTREFSSKFVELMTKEYYDPDVKYMLWDDFQIRHIKELKLKVKGYDDAECKEFDTTEDILQFYPNFKDFIEQFFAEEEITSSKTRLTYLSNYADTKTYSVVATEQTTGRLHVNENLFGPSPKVMDVLRGITREDVSLYDLKREDELALEISKKEELSVDNILVHSGSSDVIKTVMSLVLNKGDKVLLSSPSWNYYKSVVELKAAKPEYYDVKAADVCYEFDTDQILSKARTLSPRIIVITSPHNPTGAVMLPADLERIVKDNPASLVVVDEAYLGFSAYRFDARRFLSLYSNVIFCRTFSKFYALAGARVGYGLCAPIAKQVFRLDVNPFRVSNISRKMAVAALRDKGYYDELYQKITESRAFFVQAMNEIEGVKAFESASNFVFVHFDDVDVQALKDFLARNGFLVRLWTEGKELAMRVTLDTKETMSKVAHLVRDFMQGS